LFWCFRSKQPKSYAEREEYDEPRKRVRLPQRRRYRRT